LESASLLAKLQEQAPALQIYAEGEDKKKVNGLDRYNLSPSSEFAIYTTPASLNELRTIMDKVKPHKVYLFSISPFEEKSDEFLTR